MPCSTVRGAGPVGHSKEGERRRLNRPGAMAKPRAPRATKPVVSAAQQQAEQDSGQEPRGGDLAVRTTRGPRGPR